MSGGLDGVLENVLNKIKDFCNITEIGGVGEESVAKNYLPDTIGGLVGVLFGFLIEFIFIQKLRNLKKKGKLLDLLNVEFSCAVQDMEGIKKTIHFDVLKETITNKQLDAKKTSDEKVEKTSNNGTNDPWEAVKSVEGIITICERNITVTDFYSKLYRIHLPILEDVMDSSENLSLFNMKELDYLRRINISYLRFNDTYLQLSQMLDDEKCDDGIYELKRVVTELKTMTENMEKFI